MAALATFAFPAFSNAQSLPPETTWVYTLVDGSRLIDDCPVCDRLPFVGPMRGTFELRWLRQGPLSTTYALTNISFSVITTNGRLYHVTGQGTWEIGGELAVRQTFLLQLNIDNGFTNEPCYFTNASPLVTRLWPMVETGVDQTNGTSALQYHLDLNAAPFREIWFSTTTKFQAGWNPPLNAIDEGDLLASNGRIVKSNQQLTSQLGLPPTTTDLGLKDIDILPGGEIAFSLRQDVVSSTLGPLLSEDLLTDRGRILRDNGTQLIAAFQPGTPYPKTAGLAAVQVMDDGQVYFSLKADLGSKKLGVTLHPGDLLSDSGVIVRTGANLLARFQPNDPSADYGLNAVYLWPSGEIWFSTRDGFYGWKTNYFAAGDLLSDQGYVVFRNADLLASFAPTTPGDLGLDALFVVTDATPFAPVGSVAVVGAPRKTDEPPGSLMLSWNGGGRVFQLERATNAVGPFIPILPITSDAQGIDSGTLNARAQAFYRLRQW